jgi:molecular chaperone IbpA
MNGLTKLDAQVINQLNRALIGFDRMFDTVEQRAINTTGYPPHNIVRLDENLYCIEMAVAGFKKSEVQVEVEDNTLTVRGTSGTPNESATREYLHRGLSSRDFVRSFPLAEHMVVNDAKIENGVLTINIERIVPEALKARVIDIVEVK